MKIPAIRASIGDWVYYVSTMKFKDVSEYVKRIDKELHKSDLLKQLLQRSITNNYKSIAQYIKTQQERFFNALVLAVYDGDPLWHEVRLEYEDGSEFYNLGMLELSGDEKIFPIDGQHRVEGIREVVNETDEYNNEQIPVIFVGHKTTDEGMQRSRRLFSTLNRYAKPVSMRDIIALDEDDIIAIGSRELIDNHPLFSTGRILDARSKSIPESNKTAFTSIIAFYECNREILWLLVENLDVFDSEGRKKSGRSKIKEYIKRRPSDEEIKQYNSISNQYWTSFMNTFSDVKSYSETSADSSPYRNRDGGNILFRPIVLIPFVKATVRVIAEKELTAKEVFELFPVSLLSINHTLWQNIIWNADKGTMITNNKTLTEKIVLYFLDSSLLKSDDLASMKTDIKTLKQLNTTEEVDQILASVYTN